VAKDLVLAMWVAASIYVIPSGRFVIKDADEFLRNGDILESFLGMASKQGG
jgi:hypothetical protein